MIPSLVATPAAIAGSGSDRWLRGQPAAERAGRPDPEQARPLHGQMEDHRREEHQPTTSRVQKPLSPLATTPASMQPTM